MKQLSKISILLFSFLFFSNVEATTVEISGLINHELDPDVMGADIINANIVTSAIANSVDGVTIRFPQGTYYIGKTISHIENEISNKHIHIDIPNGTVIKASARLKAPVFSIAHEFTDGYHNGSICISGNGNCDLTNRTLGGVIDTSEADSGTNNSAFSNIGALAISNFATTNIQGLNITGHSNDDYSNENNRYGDTGIAGTGKRIYIRFNKISGYLDAGVYVSGKEVNNIELSEQIVLSDNEFNNINSAVVLKRGYKKAVVIWNTFSYNNTDIGATYVGSEGELPFNAYPAREVVAFGNRSQNVKAAFFISYWGKPHLKSGTSDQYRPSHHIHNNTIVDAFRKGDNNCIKPHNGALFRLINTEYAHISDNKISTCHQKNKVFAIFTKKFTYGTDLVSSHGRCNTVANNFITNADNIIYEGSEYKFGTQGEHSTHSNLYSNNTIITNGIDAFISGGIWSRDGGTTTIIRNGVTQCVSSQTSSAVDEFDPEWLVNYSTELNENFISYGVCPIAELTYPCDHFKIVRP